MTSSQITGGELLRVLRFGTPVVETVTLDGRTDVRRGTFVGVFRGEIRIRPVGGGLEWGAKAEDVALDLTERVRQRNRNSRIGGAGRASA